MLNRLVSKTNGLVLRTMAEISCLAKLECASKSNAMQECSASMAGACLLTTHASTKCAKKDSDATKESASNKYISLRNRSASLWDLLKIESNATLILQTNARFQNFNQSKVVALTRMGNLTTSIALVRHVLTQRSISCLPLLATGPLECASRNRSA